jgi:hypothetical protein
MRLIDAEKLKNFFFSETSGTEDIIRDLMDAHGLDYVNDIDEDAVMAFADDLLKAVQNVIDTEQTAYDPDKVVEQLRDEEELSYADFEIYAEEHGLSEDDDWHYRGLGRAVEIVKRGGADGKTD